jgi:hypothetical protein
LIKEDFPAENEVVSPPTKRTAELNNIDEHLTFSSRKSKKRGKFKIQTLVLTN